MKMLNAIAAAAIIGASFMAASPAKAAGCYPSLAAKIIDEVMQGGGSAKDAIDAAVSEGNINSQGCVTRVRGYMRNYSVLYPSTLQLMGW
jgi:hypothetical protein